MSITLNVKLLDEVSSYTKDAERSTPIRMQIQNKATIHILAHAHTHR